MNNSGLDLSVKQARVRLHFRSTPNILWMEGLAGILKRDANFLGGGVCGKRGIVLFGVKKYT